jgi:hypothetical protein
MKYKTAQSKSSIILIFIQVHNLISIPAFTKLTRRTAVTATLNAKVHALDLTPMTASNARTSKTESSAWLNVQLRNI